MITISKLLHAAHAVTAYRDTRVVEARTDESMRAAIEDWREAERFETHLRALVESLEKIDSDGYEPRPAYERD